MKDTTLVLIEGSAPTDSSCALIQKAAALWLAAQLNSCEK